MSQKQTCPGPRPCPKSPPLRWTGADSDDGDGRRGPHLCHDCNLQGREVGESSGRDWRRLWQWRRQACVVVVPQVPATRPSERRSHFSDFSRISVGFLGFFKNVQKPLCFLAFLLLGFLGFFSDFGFLGFLRKRAKQD